MKRLLLNNGGLKLLSLTLAAGLWFYVNRDRSPEITDTLDVPVVYQGLREGYALKEKEETARIVIKGPGAVMARVSARDFEARADLSRLGEGEHEVTAAVANKRGLAYSLNNAVRVKAVIVKMETRTFPIKPIVRGSLPLGLKAGQAKSTPEEAVLSGSSEALARVMAVEAKIDLQGRTKTFQQVARLEAVDENGKPAPGATLDPPQANVLVAIQAAGLSVEIPVAIRYDENIPGEFDSAEPEPSLVSLEGPSEVLADVKKVFTRKLSTRECLDKGSVRLGLIIPEGLTANQAEVSVACRAKKGPKGRVFDNVKVDVGKRTEGYDITLDPPVVTVFVQGDERRLQTIGSENIYAVVDVAGLGPGRRRTPVKAVAYPDMDLKLTADPPQINVTLKRIE